jgi:D-alanyl-D-alanine carboxypeptidase
MQINTNHFSKNDLLNITKSPGAQYILIDLKGTLKELNAGYADLRTKLFVSSETTFNNFSVTKTATAASILQLSECKRLQLDNLANIYFDEFQFKYPFTIQQLLSHEAGFADPIPISWIHLASEEKKFDEQEFICKIVGNNSKQMYVPGKKFKYSSIGYLLLSRIIEKVSGMEYSEYVSKNILSKLLNVSKHSNDIKSGSLSFEIKNQRNHATGYHPKYSFSNLLLSFFLDRKKYIDESIDSWTSFNNFYVNGKAYGGFIGNVRGLSSYLYLYLSNSIMNKPETMQLMFTEQKGGMAFGWFTGQLKGNKYVCHAGGGGRILL